MFCNSHVQLSANERKEAGKMASPKELLGREAIN